MILTHYIFHHDFFPFVGLFGLPPIVGPAIGLIAIYVITKVVRSYRGDTKESDRFQEQLDAKERRIRQQERMAQLQDRERELEEREKRLR